MLNIKTRKLYHTCRSVSPVSYPWQSNLLVLLWPNTWLPPWHLPAGGLPFPLPKANQTPGDYWSIKHSVREFLILSYVTQWMMHWIWSQDKLHTVALHWGMARDKSQNFNFKFFYFFLFYINSLFPMDSRTTFLFLICWFLSSVEPI